MPARAPHPPTPSAPAPALPAPLLADNNGLRFLYFLASVAHTPSHPASQTASEEQVRHKMSPHRILGWLFVLLFPFSFSPLSASPGILPLSLRVFLSVLGLCSRLASDSGRLLVCVLTRLAAGVIAEQ